LIIFIRLLVADASDDTAGTPTADAATDTTNGGEPATGSPAAVSIVDFAYDRADIEIAVGDTVTFTSEGASTKAPPPRSHSTSPAIIRTAAPSTST